MSTQASASPTVVRRDSKVALDPPKAQGVYRDRSTSGQMSFPKPEPSAAARKLSAIPEADRKSSLSCATTLVAPEDADPARVARPGANTRDRGVPGAARTPSKPIRFEYHKYSSEQSFLVAAHAVPAPNYKQQPAARRTAYADMQYVLDEDQRTIDERKKGKSDDASCLSSMGCVFRK